MSNPEPTPEEIKIAHTQVARAYLEAAMQLLYFQKHGELNYVKTAIETPEGGKYVLALLHVEGPKIDIQVAVGPSFGGK